MRCDPRAGWRDGSERLCQEIDESSTRYNRRHISPESGVSALRPRQPHGRRTRVGSIRSVFRRSRSAKASQGRWACRGCPWRAIGGGRVGATPAPHNGSVARSLSPRECFGDLACDPFRGWIGCDVDPDKVSANPPNDDEDIEQIEANGRNNEQVHGGDVGCVVTQEDAPALGRRSTSLAHVLRDAGLSDLEAELEQLAMDARRTPQRIFRAHLSDQRAQIRGDLRSASKRAGFPTPVPTEAGPMPTDKGLRSDDRDGLQDRWEPSIQLDQEQAIPVREVDTTAHLPPQHDQ